MLPSGSGSPDFTYCRTWAGWVYVAFILDVCAQRIVAWHATTCKKRWALWSPPPSPDHAQTVPSHAGRVEDAVGVKEPTCSQIARAGLRDWPQLSLVQAPAGGATMKRMFEVTSRHVFVSEFGSLPFLQESFALRSYSKICVLPFT